MPLTQCMRNRIISFNETCYNLEDSTRYSTVSDNKPFQFISELTSPEDSLSQWKSVFPPSTQMLPDHLSFQHFLKNCQPATTAFHISVWALYSSLPATLIHLSIYTSFTSRSQTSVQARQTHVQDNWRSHASVFCHWSKHRTQWQDTDVLRRLTKVCPAQLV